MDSDTYNIALALGVVLVAVGTLLIAVFGLWLVHLGDWGYGSGWVDASIALYIAALALGGLGGQRPKQARRLATELAGRNAPVSKELRGLLDDRISLGESIPRSRARCGSSRTRGRPGAAAALR